MCPEKLVDYRTSPIFGNQHEFLGFYGCLDIDKGQSHDEGAWVLAYTGKDLPSNPQELLEEFLDAASNMTALVSDFQINDFSSEHSCSCPSCSYTLECPADEVEPVYDYYQGINYDDYPQYYSNNYDYEYPNYYGDAPAYYYYDYNYDGQETTSTTEAAVNETVWKESVTESVAWETTVDVRTTENSFFAEKSSDVSYTTIAGLEVEHSTEIVQASTSLSNETFEVQ